LNTIPSSLPVGVVVGDTVGAAVGAPVGDFVGVDEGFPVGVDVGVPVGPPVGELVGDPVGASVGVLVGKKYPSRSVAIPPEGTLTVVGSVPTVCWYPGGNVPSTMSITVDPIFTSAIYMPVASVVKV
jgi:hypothetical protein